MCGLYGIFPIDKSFLQESVLKTISHRGPDDYGLLNRHGGVLGHTRLSILDLSQAGHQPMVDTTSRFAIVYNGEVYNYRELYEELRSLGESFASHSDTEVILTGYRVWGDKLFSRLRGMFAFAIHDNDTGEVFLVRDRLGIKPLLYFNDGNHFAFASELKPLLASGVVKSVLDPVSLHSLFRFGSIVQPRTMIEGVRNLPPGHMMKWSPDGTFILQQYYYLSPEDFFLTESSYDDAVIQLRARLEEATRAHLVADVEVGCFLSGGIDSTAVLALMQKEVQRPIHAFSLGFESQGEVTDESLIAERSAKAIGARFTRSVVTDRVVSECFSDFIKAIDQPSIDGFNTFLVSKEAARHVKVVLSGLGGDELFAGYPHFATIFAMADQNSRLWDPVIQGLHALRPNRFTRFAALRGKSPLNALQQIRTIYADREISQMLDKQVDNHSLIPENPALSVLQSVSYAEITGYLRNTLLRDSDVVSMWHGLEVRPVLLDSPLVDYALRLPDEYKVRDGRLKAVFIDAVKDLLPDEVLSLPKRGFEIPFAHWMNGVLRDRLMGYWESDSAKELLNENYRKRLMRRTSGRSLRRRDWLLAVLVGWLEEVN